MLLEQLRKKRESEQGFTLIELLIVIIVLGILAAIVVFAVGSTRKDSVSSACRTNVKSIQLSVEAQNTKNGGYPSLADATDTTKGALLKAMPSAADYTLTYAPTGTASGGVYPGYQITGSGKIAASPTITDASTDTNVKDFCVGS